MKTRILLIASLLMVAMVAACAPQATSTAPGQGGPIEGQTSLVDQLRAAGAEVEPGESLEQPFLSVTGQIIRVNGEDVQVFEYASSEAMEADAAQISADGSSAANSVISWIATPHFFKSGRLLVLYVGEDATLLSTLESLLGEQFAGG